MQGTDAVLEVLFKFPARQGCREINNRRIRALAFLKNLFAHASANGGQPGGDLFPPGLKLLGMLALLRLLDLAGSVVEPGHSGTELVILILGNWIKLVCMAAGTVDRQPDKGLANSPHQFLDFIGAGLPLHHLAATHNRVVHCSHQEANSSISLGRVGLDHIPRHLHADKFAVRHIGIERLDHPVTVRPEVLAGIVPLKPVALAEPHHVQPVTAPSLAIAG